MHLDLLYLGSALTEKRSLLYVDVLSLSIPGSPCDTIQICKSFGLNTPSYKKTILESKQPVPGIDFFFRFSPRLSENYYSRAKFIANKLGSGIVILA